VLCGELAEQYYFVDEVYRVGAGASLLASALFPLGPLAVLTDSPVCGYRVRY
jgi:hypothetical protein